jgi:hypothetical protein
MVCGQHEKPSEGTSGHLEAGWKQPGILKPLIGPGVYSQSVSMSMSSALVDQLGFNECGAYFTYEHASAKSGIETILIFRWTLRSNEMLGVYVGGRSFPGNSAMGFNLNPIRNTETVMPDWINSRRQPQISSPTDRINSNALLFCNTPGLRT